MRIPARFLWIVATLAVGLACPLRAWPAWTTMVSNGPSANRIDVVFLGDGYTDDGTATSQVKTVYPAHIQAMLDHLFAATEDPFPRYSRYFNVHRINVVSNESGADVPPLNVYRDTALDASYYWDGVNERSLYVNAAKATAKLNAELAGAGFSAEIRLLTVNDTRYGGSGGAFAVYAGGHASAPELALHELGHSFSGLADEYDYGDGATWGGLEPPEVNVTRSPTGAKWSPWLGYVDPAHTGIGPVGAYEGAKYFEFGLYRPTSTSKMRALGQPFNAVSREQVIRDIYQYVTPLDGWLGNQFPLTDPADLWVDVVDPTVIKLQWSVDGQPVNGATGEHFDPRGLALGNHTISARAYDDTPWVRGDRSELEQTIAWSVTVTVPEPSGLALLLLAAPMVLWWRARSKRAAARPAQRRRPDVPVFVG